MMKKQIELTVHPDSLHDKKLHKKLAAKKLGADVNEITALIPLKRSIDARKSAVFRIRYEVYIDEPYLPPETDISYKPVKQDKHVIIAGFGPAGMFASLKLIEAGIKPVVLERGKNVRDRRFDIGAIQKNHLVNPDSNYCFGEGGAGAYSDGKLFTRSTKRGDVKRILNILVRHGADPDILIDAHPHIGSNKLPKIVSTIRETILSNGGEIHFNSRITDLVIKNGTIAGVVVNDRVEIPGHALILATGHSAVDIYYMLKRHDIRLEAKPFAMGVRIEHPQKLINEIQYHSKTPSSNLPAASYTLTCQTSERAAFSFCMCPGGIIVPAATCPGEQVVNGMSVSQRNSPFANSGFVVSVGEREWADYEDENEFAGLKLRMALEKLAFELGGQSQAAPAQKAADFLTGIISTTLNPSSYIPGVISAPLHERLPRFMVKGLGEALTIFNKKMPGFSSNDAQLIGLETRTSSPVRIPRDKTTFMNPDLQGLFPCAEGAGHAGGIVSAAMDGENCAQAAVTYMEHHGKYPG
ncbi:FAD-dependent protein [uncultured Desulfobacter sp.]|uniref:NAD(P)/FAD-dependent oxidoreductase n=1 Tax=uncultured Desulfobacter sp. TaxID=240139 RepID=UPI002AAAC082|nr:FAD-binding protein [uncultured Desulfobacter sp.]